MEHIGQEIVENERNSNSAKRRLRKEVVNVSGVKRRRTGRYVRGGATTSHVTEESGQC